MRPEIHDALLSNFQKIGIDDEQGVLHGVIIASKGEARGHGLYLGDAALDELAKLKSVPFRVDPPPDSVHGGAMAIEGEAVNFRRDGDDVRADVKLFDLPGGQRARVLKLAQTAAHLIGMSLDLSYQVVRELANKLKEIVPVAVRSLDLVHNPAAARALFQQPPVDTTPAIKMDYTFLRSQCAKFAIEFPADDKDVTDDIRTKAQADLTAKQDAQAARLSHLESRFCPDCGAPSEGRCESCNAIVDRVGKTVYFTKTDDGKFEPVKLAQLKALIEGPAPSKPAPKSDPSNRSNPSDNPPPPDARLTEKDLDAIVAKLQAKGLAGIAGKPAKPDGDPDAGAKGKLQPQVVKLARQLYATQLATVESGLQARFIEEKGQALVASLAELSPEEQKVCFELQIDPAAFAATRDKCAAALRN